MSVICWTRIRKSKPSKWLYGSIIPAGASWAAAKSYPECGMRLKNATKRCEIIEADNIVSFRSYFIHVFYSRWHMALLHGARCISIRPHRAACYRCCYRPSRNFSGVSTRERGRALVKLLSVFCAPSC